MKVDERFQSLLKNESFQSFKSDSSGKMDQYGRKQQRLRKSKKAIASNDDDMLEYYDVESDVKKVLSVSSDAPSSSTVAATTAATAVSADNNLLPRLDYLTKLARGEISGDSSSSDASSSDGELDDDDSDASSESSDSIDKLELDHQQQQSLSTSSNQRSALSIPYQLEPELSADIQSSRLAIQNCDWENVSAQDLM